MKAIPYGRQSVDSREIREVVKALKSGWISQGPRVQKFEKAFARYCGAKYAVAVSSGTAALHLACKAADLKSGDEAITTAMTFMATSNAVLMNGAKPIFADIDYDTVNIDPECIKSLINKKTKAILPVHFAGLSVEMDKIKRIAKKHRLIVIEDASHALSAKFKGHRIGDCQYSDMTCFSFHPVKHITTGEGGCITTNSKYLYERLMALRNHGVYKSEKLKRKHGGWFTEMRELGFNYRLSDFQCAMGLIQLKKADRFLSRRAAIAKKYNKAFSPLKDIVKLPKILVSHSKQSWHLYLLRLRSCTQKNRKDFYDSLKKKGVNTHVPYIPVYQQPYYKKILGKSSKRCLNAEKYYKEVVSLPIYPDLTDKEIQKVVRAVKASLKEVIKK